VAAGILQAIGQIGRQIGVADRFAGRQRAIAKDQKRLALPQAVQLTRQRFEIGGGAHDAVGQARCDQRRLEGQFCMLKRQGRLLHADC
jgi:hypothetical protein